VEPVAGLVPQLLQGGDGASLVLADPPTRTPRNRARFLELVGASGMVLEEAGMERAAIDAMRWADSEESGEDDLFELVGKTGSSEVTLTVFRNSLLGSTIGVKR